MTRIGLAAAGLVAANSAAIAEPSWERLPTNISSATFASRPAFLIASSSSATADGGFRIITFWKVQDYIVRCIDVIDEHYLNQDGYCEHSLGKQEEPNS